MIDRFPGAVTTPDYGFWQRQASDIRGQWYVGLAHPLGDAPTTDFNGIEIGIIQRCEPVGEPYRVKPIDRSSISGLGDDRSMGD
jgi:hypothetical protein